MCWSMSYFSRGTSDLIVPSDFINNVILFFITPKFEDRPERCSNVSSDFSTSAAAEGRVPQRMD